MVESIHSHTKTEYYPSNNSVFQEREIDITLELFTKQMQFLYRSHASLHHTYTHNTSNYRQNVVDDGWTVTNYNDVVWEEPGTCEGRATITRGQYEDFAKGIGELQKAISSLEKRGIELQRLSLQQQIQELEKLKGESWSKIGDKAIDIIIHTLTVILSKGSPIAMGLQIGLDLKVFMAYPYLRSLHYGKWSPFHSIVHSASWDFSAFPPFSLKARYRKKMRSSLFLQCCF